MSRTFVTFATFGADVRKALMNTNKAISSVQGKVLKSIDDAKFQLFGCLNLSRAYF